MPPLFNSAARTAAPTELRPGRLLAVPAVIALVAALLARLAGAPAFWLHLGIGAAVLVGCLVTPRHAPARFAPALAALISGVATWLPWGEIAPGVGTLIHAVSALLVLLVLLAGGAWARTGLRSCVGWVLAGTVAVGVYAVADSDLGAWRPPAYDAAGSYRFLTATTRSQSGEIAFPSALRRRVLGEPDGCESSGCHPRRSGRIGHGAAGANPAFRATLAEFRTRRGDEPARWCLGCHQPQAVEINAHSASKPVPTSPGIACTTCHAARTVHAQYGAAALEVGVGSASERAPWGGLLRPRAHRMAMHRTGLLRSSELCGACHQKNWGLAQNGRRWLPGPDEFHEWQESRFSGQSLFVAGPEEARGCTGCHDPHGGAPPSRPPAVAVELFLRGTESDGRPSLTRAESAPVALQTWRLRPRQPLLLEVVVANEGVGHDFPAGMPDLRETWLEVEVLDSAGKPVLENGRAAADTELSPATFVFRLDARDAGGKPITHGDLDRMDSLASWRRISPGGAVLARYALRVPEAGVGGIRARLRRRVRPAFRRWCAGLGDEQRVLAERTVVRGRTVAPDSVAWRRYGVALMGEKAYPFALAALRHSIYFGPGGPEADLILGQIHLEEGNLMAARQQFGRLAETGLDRARAWEGAVLRRMGLYSEATHRLAPLSRRYPRDRRLRFELGLTFLAQLRNEAALREFDAMLAVDPTDPAAHYNRMLCLQRLNDLPGVRREEALYKLLAAPEGGRAPAGTVPLAGRTPAGTAPMPLEPPGPPLTPIASPATEYAPRLGGPR